MEFLDILQLSIFKIAAAFLKYTTKCKACFKNQSEKELLESHLTVIQALTWLSPYI